MSEGSDPAFRGFSPYIYYEDGAAAIDWLVASFGFREKVRYLDETGVVREAEMFAGDTLIMIHGAAPGFWSEQAAPAPVGQMSIVYVDDVDAHHARATAAGVEASGPTDQPYGARIYMVDDPEGHSWTFWQHLRDEVELQPGWTEVTPG
jgi:uncharacterized glyoxalase superfamily protein PhnB